MKTLIVVIALVFLSGCAELGFISTSISKDGQTAGCRITDRGTEICKVDDGQGGIIETERKLKPAPVE